MKYLLAFLSLTFILYTCTAQSGTNTRVKIKAVTVKDSLGTSVLPAIPLNTAIMYEVNFQNVDVTPVSGYIGLVIRYPSGLIDTLGSVEDSVMLLPHSDTVLHYHDYTAPAKYSGGGGVVVVVVWPAYSESPIFLHEVGDETPVQLYTAVDVGVKMPTIRLSPNPVFDVLWLVYDNPQQIRSLTIVNTLGQVLFYSEKEEQMIRFDSFERGVYRLLVHTESGQTLSLSVLKR